MVSDPELQKKKERTVRERLMEEAGYMKKGAKRLPSVMEAKAKEAMKKRWEEWKEQGRREAELQKKAKDIERKAYEEEYLRQAAVSGKVKAKQRKGGGLLQKLGEAGERLDVGDMLGMKDVKPQKKGDSEDLLGLGGLGKVGEPDYWGGLGKKPSPKREVHIHIHTDRKKRKRK